MQPVPSASGTKVNWSNYKTGNRHIHFRMYAERNQGSIAIELSAPSAGVREKHFARMQQLQGVLSGWLREEWICEQHAKDVNGKLFSRIYKELPDADICIVSDWPRIISFLKPRIMSLDAFWYEVREGFE